jgi:hypothetical protein
MTSERRSVFAFAAGRRAKWVVFLVWLVGIFIAAGPANLPGKFTDAEDNESTSYLPGDAQSTKALEATENLQGGELAPAVIVYRRASGLTPADMRKIRRDVQRLTEERFPGVIADGATAAAGGRQAGATEGAAGAGGEATSAGRRAGRPGAAEGRPRRSRASRPITRHSLAPSAHPTARPRSSPPTSRATARATGSSIRSTPGATSCPIRAAASR